MHTCLMASDSTGGESLFGETANLVRNATAVLLHPALAMMCSVRVCLLISLLWRVAGCERYVRYVLEVLPWMLDLTCSIVSAVTAGYYSEWDENKTGTYLRAEWIEVRNSLFADFECP